MKRRKNARFPIDQCAVAIKGEDFEASEVEHARGIRFNEKRF
jgi:hypothetical protein